MFYSLVLTAGRPGVGSPWGTVGGSASQQGTGCDTWGSSAHCYLLCFVLGHVSLLSRLEVVLCLEVVLASIFPLIDVSCNFLESIPKALILFRLS